MNLKNFFQKKKKKQNFSVSWDNCLKLPSKCEDHIFIWFQTPHFISHFFHLKKCKPSEWWKEVKKLSGQRLASTTQSDTLKWLQHLHHWGYWPKRPSVHHQWGFLIANVVSVEPVRQKTIKAEPVQSQRFRQYSTMVVKGTHRNLSWSGIWHLELLVPWRTPAIDMKARRCSRHAKTKARRWSK